MSISNIFLNDHTASLDVLKEDSLSSEVAQENSPIRPSVSKSLLRRFRNEENLLKTSLFFDDEEASVVSSTSDSIEMATSSCTQWDTTQIDTITFEQLWSDYEQIKLEYLSCRQKKDYYGAANACTKELDILPVLGRSGRFSYGYDVELDLHARRAESYAQAGEYAKAHDDLTWIKWEYEGVKDILAPDIEYSTIDVPRGIVDLLEGKKLPLDLCLAAYHCNSLALLLLNEPENFEPIQDWWLLLDEKERLQKYLENRHYTQAIELIDRMIFNPRYCSDGNFIAIRGACYALQGNYQKANESYRQFALPPGNWNKHTEELAIVYARSGFKDKAINLLELNWLVADPIARYINQPLLLKWIEQTF